jgi:hypothetical protein
MKQPCDAMEKNKYKLYLDTVMLADQTITSNRSDISVKNKKTKKV